LAERGQRRFELLAGIGGVGEHVTQPRKGMADSFEHGRSAVAVLDISRVHHRADEKPSCVRQQMALAAFDLLAGIVAARPAQSEKRAMSKQGDA
jgi:hypothetical protein